MTASLQTSSFVNKQIPAGHAEQGPSWLAAECFLFSEVVLSETPSLSPRAHQHGRPEAQLPTAYSEEAKGPCVIAGGRALKHGLLIPTHPS